MALDRWIPLGIRRGSRSFFDPSWEVGDDWDDWRSDWFPRSSSSSRGSSNQYHLERKMARMQDDMDRFFNNVSNAYQLTPRSSSRELMPRDQARDFMLSPRDHTRDMPMPRSPMSRRHLRLHASEASRMTSSSNGSSMTSSNLNPLALRAVEEVTIEHPVVVDKNGVKKMELNFDVRAFKPGEIQVKTKDNEFLEVHAAHEEKSENGLVKREYHRMFSIPKNTDINHMHSVLSPEGVLTVEAPMLNQDTGRNRHVPPKNTDINHMHSVLSPEGVLTVEAPMLNQDTGRNRHGQSISVTHE